MSDVIARGGIEVYGDTTSFEVAMAKAEAAAKRFEQVGVGAAARGAAGVGAGAKGAAEGVKELDAATQRAINSLTLQRAKLTESAGAYELIKARVRGLNVDALLPHAAALDLAAQRQAVTGKAAEDFAKRLGLVGVSAGQATAAMRQLPAQLTDVFTGLASGQSPFTVLIQQGGQLKDSFGGVGNTLRALGSVLTPVRLAMAGMAGAVVGLGVAYKLGAAEADEFRRALVLTGNAAGASMGELQAAAAGVARSVGTQAQAAEVIAQLAASGRVAAADVGKLAEAAIRLERVGGPAAQETAKAFAELGKDPVKASAALNESTNYLTLSVHRQIRALAEQGKTAAAASLAQKAYADAVIQRAGELDANLGTIERAWRTVTNAAKGAWDAMLGVGRQQTPDEAMAGIRQRIGQLQDRLAGGRIGAANITDFLAGDDTVRANLESMREMERALKRSVVAQTEAAQGASKRAQVVRDGIKADDEAAKAAKKHADELRRLIEQGRDMVQAADLRQAGLAPGFLKDMQALQAYAKAAGQSTQWLQEQTARLVQQQPFVQEGIKRTIAEYRALAAMQDLRAEGEAEIAAAEKAAQDARRASIEQVQSSVQAARDEAAAAQLVADMRFTEAQAIARVTLARMEDQRQSLVNNPLELQALEQRIQLQRELVALTDQKATREANAKAAAASLAEWQSMAEDLRSSLTDAFRRAFESGEDFGTAMVKVLEREIKARLATAMSGLLADAVLGFAGVRPAGQAGAVGGNGGAASWMQMLQTGQTLYRYGANAYNWATGAGAMYSTSAGTLGVTGAQGAFVGEGAASGVAAWDAAYAGSSSASAGAGGASSIGWAGWVAAAILAAMQGSADWSAGFRRQQSRESGTALGDASFRTADLFSRLGVSDRIADMISGATLTARLFGRAAPRLEAQGASGSITAGNFTGSAFADIIEKGGLFRSDRRSTQLAELPEDLGRFLDQASQSVLEQARKFGDALGLPAEALASVTTDIRVVLTDDVEANKAEFAKALGGYGEALVAAWADAVAPLAQYGESTAQTIQRVGGALLGVNEVLQTIGANALAASIDGGRAALALQDIFGGLQGLQQAAGSFATNYLTDAERTQAGLAAVGRVLEQMGVQTPRTREQFADLVRAQDLTTESGRAAMAGLLGVADAFAQLTPATAELQAAIERVLPKFGGTGDSAAYDRIATNLRGAGFDLNAGQLLAASKAQVYEYARAVVESADVTMAAKLAIVDAAGALADLKDAAAEAAQAAADAAAALAARVADGLAAVIGDFASPDEVARVRAGRIAATLAGGGITVGAQQIIGSTREDIVALWRSVGDEGRAAILEAYDAWQELQRGIQDARIADILRGVAGSVDELSQAYAQIVPQSETLVQQWQRAGQEMDQLARALDDIAGTGAPTALQQLQASVAQRDGLQRIIGSNADRAFQLRAGAGDASALQLLRTREADLWRQYAGTANPELAAAITETTLQRIDLEGRLQQQAAAATIDALQQQLDTAQRLRDIAAQVGDYITSLKAGNLSALGYTGRLAAGQQLLDRAIATGGDVTGAASALLSGGQQAFGGATAAYAGLFNRVVGQLEGVAAGGPGFAADVSAAQAQIAHLQSISDTSMQQAQALDTLNATFGADLAGVSASIQTQTAALTEQLSELRAMKTTLEAQITQAAEAYRRLVQAQERTADAVESIDERAELEAAAP
jgi:phage-related minor tail protein